MMPFELLVEKERIKYQIRFRWSVYDMAFWDNPLLHARGDMGLLARREKGSKSHY